MRFDEFGFDPALMLGIRDMRYQEATPIQEQAIPAVINGKDVIGLAQTGTGKTAAFLLPILQRVMPGHTGATRALILAPTRELASQIDDVRVGLTYHTAISGALVLGGANADIQERALKAVPDIVIATPGRLLDFLFRNLPKLDKIEILVLDEADRMLDMGFLPDIEKILRRLPEKRQNLMFSATMPPPIEKLAREIMRDPVAISIGARSRPVEKIRHIFERIDPHHKTRRLVDALRDRSMESVIVFTKTKSGADRLWRDLVRAGIHDSVAIHGDRTQQERFHALELFKSRQIRVLIATDVAARGIDVDSVSHVVNFDLPRTFEDYVHRVGRTARAGESGIAVTLVTPEDERAARRYEQNLDEMRAKSRQLQPAAATEPPAAPPRQRSDAPRSDEQPRRDEARDGGRRPERPRDDHRRRDEPRRDEHRRPERPREDFRRDERPVRQHAERPASREPVAPHGESRPTESRAPHRDTPRDPNRERPRDEFRRIDRPRDDRQRDDRPRTPDPRSDRPREDRPRHERPGGERRHDARRPDDRRSHERGPEDRGGRERLDRGDRRDAPPPRERSVDPRRAEGSPTGRPNGDRPHSDRPRHDRPQQDRPQSERPRQDRPRDERPADRPREERPARVEPTTPRVERPSREEPTAPRDPRPQPTPPARPRDERAAPTESTPPREPSAPRRRQPAASEAGAPSARAEPPVSRPEESASDAPPKKKVAKKATASKKPAAAKTPRSAPKPKATDADAEATDAAPARKAAKKTKARPKKAKPEDSPDAS